MLVYKNENTLAHTIYVNKKISTPLQIDSKLLIKFLRLPISQNNKKW